MYKQIFYHKIILRNNKVILDAPLLFETKILEHLCDPIICVYIEDEGKQLKRLMKRNNFTKEEAQKRIDSQYPIKEKVLKSDIVIENGEKKEDLERQIA